MIDNRNRAFHYAVLASLALHALLLFAFPDFIDTARRAASLPPQIIARLIAPEPAPDPVVPVEPVRREAPPPPKAAKPARPEALPEAPPAPKPAPVLSTPQPAPVPAPPVQAAAPPSPPVAALEPQPQPQSASPPQASPPPPAQAPESLSRDQYRLQLIDEARRHKRYPPLARENNWQGDVRVAVAIAANGRPSVTLKGSSGYEVLDRQALEMFTQAARAVPIPPALRGKEFALEVRAVYGLED
ncbi:MAG TPA: energy transducer TonB [Burkholderiales bacterium]